MPLPGVFQAFLVQDQQRLVQPIQRVYRRRMVIGTSLALAPVTHDQVQVEKPGTDRCVARLDGVHGTAAEAHRREPRRTGQALLGAAVGGIGAPVVEVDVDATQRGHAVDDGQAVVFTRQSTQCFRVGSRAGRGLGMHERDQFRVRVLLQRGIQFLRIDGPAPVIFDDDRFAAQPPDVVRHAAAEHAVPADDDLVAGLHQVDEAGFHAGRPGCGNRNRELVAGPERKLQQRLDFIHEADEFRVQVTHRGPRHGAKHAWIDIGGSRPHQRAGRGIESLIHTALLLGTDPKGTDLDLSGLLL